MSNPQKNALIKILSGIDFLDAPDHSKRDFRAFVTQVCFECSIRLINAQERIDFARRLLNLKEPRATIRDRLMVRFHIGRSQAYRIIDTALTMSHKSAIFGTCNLSNTSSK